MFELIKSMVFALVMVPVVMAVILGLIYGLGELFNIISKKESKNLERKL
ncbi:AcrZ family multidrug efflux pump-associated protein [Xenorhabdus sp. SGI246]